VRSTFLDSNIIVYAYDERYAWKQERALNVVADGGVISVQSLNECANVFIRKQRRTWREVRVILDQLQRWCEPVLPLTIAVQRRAVDIAAQHGLRIYDACIVATALEAGCETLLSEDLQDGRVFEGRLTIRNPFATQ
jgi:predicted nucleic acid-binding protein